MPDLPNLRPTVFDFSAEELQRHFSSPAPLIPELETARENAAALRETASAQSIFEQSQATIADFASIPQTRYTDYRRLARDGSRKEYERPYFDKRAVLSALALRVFLGQHEYAGAVEDYLWNICEETNWVVPAHEDRVIDLMAAETGFVLGEVLLLLGDTIHWEVRHRVQQEVDRRLFAPYLQRHNFISWYRGASNWNGVCNSSVAATFLLLEPDIGRAATAVAIALRGLKFFLEGAFEADGASTEGVAYWHYGLHNYIAFSELLRARTGGAVDLLTGEKMKAIAAYPAKMRLSGRKFATFSDCDPELRFYPGIITRLAERTGEQSLLDLRMTPGVAMERPYWRMPMLLRDLLWWNGELGKTARSGDAVLEDAAVACLTSSTPAGTPVVLAVKAGHNDEHHNQNDVGSFILHAGEETFLCDPGRGLYTRQYFSSERYNNIFANSFGHSVPRIGSTLQGTGREFCGKLKNVDTNSTNKRVEIEFARAYPLSNLESLSRVLELSADGALLLQDQWEFSTAPQEVEEAFLTWLEVEVAANTATILGEEKSMRVTIEEPAGAEFQLQHLEAESAANQKPQVLKRLSFAVPGEAKSVRVRFELV